MKTDEMMQALLREYPHGVSFAPMALRLLRQKLPLKDSQIEDLKAQMFQMGDGLWYSREMISNETSLSTLRGQVTAWLSEQGCFSVERLLGQFCGVLRHVATPENLAAFLRHLGFTVAEWRRSGFFCFQPPRRLDERLAEITKTIVELLDGADGTMAIDSIEEAMPHLTSEALEGIRAKFLPEVHRTEIGGIPCWRTAEATPLPEDFADKLTAAVDTLVVLEEKVSAANIEFALNLFYRIRFREVHGLPDNGAFMRLCTKHYQGGNGLFPKTKTPGEPPNDLSEPAKRLRSPNTRFRNLGIPIGAELVFVKDSHLTCIVLDDSNQVKHDGKAWAISALANHLLSVPGTNGYCFFNYEGETLWERRLRLERGASLGVHQAKKLPPPAPVSAPKCDIIGLEGQPLRPSTWRAFKSAGTNPRVAEWARRVGNGESEQSIAHENDLMVSTVKEYIKNRRRYLLVCDRNDIRPETAADV